MAAPTKYNPAFHNKEYLRLSKQGKNVTQIAAEWDISRDSIYEWANKHKTFSDTVKRGRELCEAWYITIGQRGMVGELVIDGRKVKLDVGLYVWLTKNIHKWSEKVSDVTPTRDRPLKDLTDEELEELE